MKKQTFVLWALTGMLAVPASAQVDYKTRAIVAEPEMPRWQSVLWRGMPRGQSIAIRSVCVIWG